MSTLHAELNRLYLNNESCGPNRTVDGSGLIAPDGRVRAMVMELARPADWNLLSTVWRGVQTDLDLPAPAIAVSGIDGHQLWFSLSDAVTIAQAQAFLEALRLRYLRTVKQERIRMMPSADASTRKPHHVKVIPAFQEETGRWSAFVTSDLAAIFVDEPWLDLAPNPDAQANVLSRLECIKPAVFQAIMDRIKPAVATAISQTVPPTKVEPDDKANEALLQPKQFLHALMNDRTIDLHLRIEAAKALLPYFP